MAFVHFN